MGLPENECRELAASICAEAGVDLEDFSVTKAGRREVVRVVVDRDGGIDLDAVADISRSISDALDALPLADESPFVLEVGSPGVDRPLTAERHWRRATGHLVEVKFTDSSPTLLGRITNVEGDSVTLDVAGVGTSIIHMPAVSHAVVQVEFNKGE
ncbi:MAG: ribosome maturation factor RimP [Candidatus Nanopelagicales bacterium]|jgi:ribosome maturation factor RimP